MALRKLALMHQQFGRCEGHICGECSNLISGRYRGRILRKCRVYGLTHSEASDWAKRWAACGIFNGVYTGRPIIELVKPCKLGNPGTEPLDNQISLLEEKGGAK